MFYYDGLNKHEASDLFEKGLISGITTNLTLVNALKASIGKNRDTIIEEFVDSIKHFGLPLSIQVESNIVEDIISEGLYLQDKFKNDIDVFIKVPINFENLKAIHILSERGISVNATCITSFMQAKMASISGASIVSFFWGKMYDQGINPAFHVSSFKAWLEKSNPKRRTSTLVGSVRQIGSIESAFAAGADVVTTSYENLRKIADQLASENANMLFQKTLQ